MVIVVVVVIHYTQHGPVSEHCVPRGIRGRIPARTSRAQVSTEERRPFDSEGRKEMDQAPPMGQCQCRTCQTPRSKITSIESSGS